MDHRLDRDLSAACVPLYAAIVGAVTLVGAILALTVGSLSAPMKRAAYATIAMSLVAIAALVLVLNFGYSSVEEEAPARQVGYAPKE